jgi:hypothetical protein
MIRRTGDDATPAGAESGAHNDSYSVEALAMTLILVLAAFPIGWFVRDRRTAYLVYIAAQSFLFTFQTGMLVLEWVGGSTQAFGPYPKASHGETLSYGVVNLVFFAAGLGVLALALWLRARRLQGAERSTSPHSYARTTA